MHTSIWWYLRVLPVFHRPEVVDIGIGGNTIKKVETEGPRVRASPTSLRCGP